METIGSGHTECHIVSYRSATTNSREEDRNMTLMALVDGPARPRAPSQEMGLL